MSLQVDGVWKGAVWAATVWAQCVWFEPGCTSAPTTSPSGGVRGLRIPRRPDEEIPKRDLEAEVREENARLLERERLIHEGLLDIVGRVAGREAADATETGPVGSIADAAAANARVLPLPPERPALPPVTPAEFDGEPAKKKAARRKKVGRNNAFIMMMG